MPTLAAMFRRVFRPLERWGLVLESDPSFPSVATLVAGGPVRGSWWAHPKAHDIYNVSHALGEHEDVIVAKLVSAKNTYVHRRLWPALLAVGAAREPWQLDRLPDTARRLFDAVTAAGELRTDQVPRTGGRRKDLPGEAARELERRLLVYSEEVHTETGAHAKQLETWERWARKAGARKGRKTAKQGKRVLAEVVGAINEKYKSKGRLPWQS